MGPEKMSEDKPFGDGEESTGVGGSEIEEGVVFVEEELHYEAKNQTAAYQRKQHR